MLSPTEIDIVIYHHPCPDGFTSCAIANLYFRENNMSVEYWGMSHSSNHQLVYEKMKDKNILICDFSFKKNIMDKILLIAKNVLIIDHHVSALKELEQLDDKYKIFDMSHCGAHLVWLYFFPTKPIPLFVKYIEDNDIWLKTMDKTLEMTAYVSSMEFELNQYEKMITDETLIVDAIKIGEILLKQSKKQIDNCLSKSVIKMIDLNGMTYFIGISNSTTDINEIGNQMLTKYEFINFAIVYSSINNSNSISFRSDDTRTNISLIASKCSGGGHRNASGCLLYDKHFPGNEIGDKNHYKQLKDVDFVLNCKSSKTDNKTYNCAILNTTDNKIQFAKYLLQIRSDENKDVQEAYNLYKNHKKYENKDENIMFDFAITWHYGDDRTWFVLSWKESINISDVELLFGNNKDFEIAKDKKIAKFSLSKLNIDFFN